MKTIDQICLRLTQGQFEFSHHAFQRSVVRNVSEAEIRQSAEHAVMIENYPHDKYATLYEPDENEWIDFRQRR